MVEGAPTSKPTKVDRVLARARSYVGTPYKLGGTSRRGIDCSGLMVRSFQAIDFQLPRVSAQQARVGKPIRKTELRRGDMVFFAKGKKVRGPKGASTFTVFDLQNKAAPKKQKQPTKVETKTARPVKMDLPPGASTFTVS